MLKEKDVKKNGQIWKRKSLMLLPQAAVRLKNLASQYPLSENMFVNIAIMNFDIKKMSMEDLSVVKDEEAMAQTRRMKKLEKVEELKGWLEEFGGGHYGTKAIFNKYEVTFAGEVVRNKRAFELDEMPETKEEVRKMILGKYWSVAEAEEALKNYQESKGITYVPA